MNTSNEKIIRSFYSAFSCKDSERMASLYSDTVQFSDPVFPQLSGEHARNMWRMLCKKSQDLRVTFHDIEANESTGSATWEAYYTFSGTGRKVHNIIQAHFEFQNGKITKHSDKFSFWRWSRQALGPIGILLGWTPYIRNKVRKKAAKGLTLFEQ